MLTLSKLQYSTNSDNSLSNRVQSSHLLVIVILKYNFYLVNSNPGPQEGAEWHKFYTIDGNVIAPYYDITNWPNNATNFKHDLKLTECEHHWNKYLV